MYVVAYAFTDRMRRMLQHYADGTRRKEMKEYFVKKMGYGFVFEANGYTLAVIHSLKERYWEEMNVFFMDYSPFLLELVEESGYNFEYPDELIEEIRKLKNHPKAKVRGELKNLKISLKYEFYEGGEAKIEKELEEEIRRAKELIERKNLRQS